MSDFAYNKAVEAVRLAYERKGGMTVGLPKATMSADHLALFVKEYEKLQSEVERLKADVKELHDPHPNG